MKIAFSLLLLLLSSVVSAKDNAACQGNNWLTSAWQGLQRIWAQGDNELYLTGYAWHNRATYSKEKIDFYNEAAWGGGMGKGLYDERGNWHGLYAFAFLESHKQVEPIAGYAFMKTLHLSESTKIGAGFTAFITAHQGVFNHYPFPGALPLIGVSYRRASLGALYIPGGKGAGNVLFILGKLRF